MKTKKQPKQLPFQTTDKQLLHLAWLVVSMKGDGIDESIVADAFRIATTDQGMYDLMELWNDNWNDEAEREHIMQDIMAGIRDCHRTTTKATCEDHSCAQCSDCEDYVEEIYDGGWYGRNDHE